MCVSKCLTAAALKWCGDFIFEGTLGGCGMCAKTQE